MIGPEVWAFAGVGVTGLVTIIIGQINSRAAHSKAQLEVKLAMAETAAKLDDVVDKIDVRLAVVETHLATHLAQHSTQPIPVPPRNGLRAVRKRQGGTS